VSQSLPPHKSANRPYYIITIVIIIIVVVVVIAAAADCSKIGIM
jgi:hypothetical protein